MEIGLLNTVTCPTSRPPIRKRRSSSSLLSLQLALEEDGDDGATRFMSADRGLAFRAPANVGVVGWNSTCIGQFREWKTELKSQKWISEHPSEHTFCGGREGPADDGSGFDSSVSGDFTTKLVVAEGGGGTS